MNHCLPSSFLDVNAYIFRPNSKKSPNISLFAARSKQKAVAGVRPALLADHISVRNEDFNPLTVARQVLDLKKKGTPVKLTFLLNQENEPNLSAEWVENP
jgi:hypothetical protein